MSEIRIVLDGPPSHESGRFVEVETHPDGKGISVGMWDQSEDGELWYLVMDDPRTLRAELAECKRERESQMIQLGGYLWAELALTRVVDVEVVKEGIRRIIQEADHGSCSEVCQANSGEVCPICGEGDDHA